MLVEDPLPKSSKDSFFIQLCDLVSHIVYLYTLKKLRAGKYHNRLPALVTPQLIEDWLNKLLPSLNQETAQHDPYRIVCYPQKGY